MIFSQNSVDNSSQACFGVSEIVGL